MVPVGWSGGGAWHTSVSAWGEGECSLIKAVAKMRDIFSAAPQLRSVRKSQRWDEGWEKGSCGTGRLAQPCVASSCWDTEDSKGKSSG